MKAVLRAAATEATGGISRLNLSLEINEVKDHINGFPSAPRHQTLLQILEENQDITTREFISLASPHLIK